MRQYKFRGKCANDDEWVYGTNIYIPIKDKWKTRINGRRVKPYSIGQFTGLLDRNGKEIYEGDILQWSENGCKSNPMEVVAKYGAFGYLFYGFHSLAGNTNFTFYPKGADSRFEIIGNIHDNPELQILK